MFVELDKVKDFRGLHAIDAEYSSHVSISSLYVKVLWSRRICLVYILFHFVKPKKSKYPNN